MKDWKSIRIGALGLACLFCLSIKGYAVTWGRAMILSSDRVTSSTSYLADTLSQENVPTLGLSLFVTEDNSMFLSQSSDLEDINQTSWSTPLLVERNISPTPVLAITQVGSSVDSVLLTWIGGSGYIHAALYDLSNQILGSIEMISSQAVADYDISSNGTDWCIAAQTSDGAMVAIQGGSDLSDVQSTPVAAVGEAPSVAFGATDDVVMTFVRESSPATSVADNTRLAPARDKAEASRAIVRATNESGSSQWKVTQIANSSLGAPTPQVVMGSNNSHLIAYRTMASSTADLRTGQEDVSMIQAHAFRSLNSTQSQVSTVSRLDEDVRLFSLSNNSSGLVALSYRSVKAQLPQYQLATTIQHQSLSHGFARFSGPYLLSSGESSIGVHASAVGNGRMILNAYAQRSDTALNSSAFVPSKGARGGVSSRFQNFMHSAPEAISEVHLHVGSRRALASWVHKGILYTQPASVPKGY